MGRNELCKCGSGKKYKKCCLNSDKNNNITFNKIQLSQKYDAELVQKLFNYSINERYFNEFLKAKSKFYLIKDIEINKKFSNIFNTYYMHDYISSQNKAMGILFYEENRNRLSDVETQILRNRLNSYVSIYEVVGMGEYKAILRDLFLGEETFVDDINIVNDLNVGEIIVGRIATVHEINKFIDTVFSIEEDIKQKIVEDVKLVYEECKDSYKDFKQFLVYNTNMFYKFMQQLLEPKVVQMLNAQNKTKVAKEECGCKVQKLILENIEKSLAEVAITTWEECKNKKDDLKGNESGWASALEYMVKKQNGVEITQTDIAKKYKVSPSTLGKRYKEIKDLYEKIG